MKSRNPSEREYIRATRQRKDDPEIWIVSWWRKNSPRKQAYATRSIVVRAGSKMAARRKARQVARGEMTEAEAIE